MTKARALKVLRSNPDAAIYVWHGEVYLDDSNAVRMISPSILCSLYRDGRGEIAPMAGDPSIYVAVR